MPRCLVDPACADLIAALPEGHRASVPTGPDVKWRFMHRVGPRPAATVFEELNAEPVVPQVRCHEGPWRGGRGFIDLRGWDGWVGTTAMSPFLPPPPPGWWSLQGFPEWTAVLDGWGGKMLGAVETALTLAALGFGLPADAITGRMAAGPHVLAPTGADLSRHGDLGAVIAGWHYDLNAGAAGRRGLGQGCLRMHGLQRPPPLVRLPDHRLAQAPRARLNATSPVHLHPRTRLSAVLQSPFMGAAASPACLCGGRTGGACPCASHRAACCCRRASSWSG